MRTLKIQVSDEIASKVEQAANDLGISIEDLLQISVQEKIQRDTQFGRVERDAEGWDREIERDAASDKLDRLFASSVADHRAGKSREI